MGYKADPRELLLRFAGNPILDATGFPQTVNAVFNPGATVVDGRTLLLLSSTAPGYVACRGHQ